MVPSHAHTDLAADTHANSLSDWNPLSHAHAIAHQHSAAFSIGDVNIGADGDIYHHTDAYRYRDPDRGTPNSDAHLDADPDHNANRNFNRDAD